LAERQGSSVTVHHGNLHRVEAARAFPTRARAFGYDPEDLHDAFARGPRTHRLRVAPADGMDTRKSGQGAAADVGIARSEGSLGIRFDAYD
jgi:hypothetical protein